LAQAFMIVMISVVVGKFDSDREKKNNVGEIDIDSRCKIMCNMLCCLNIFKLCDCLQLYI